MSGIAGRSMGDALKQVGLLPPDCTDVEILGIGVNDVLTIRYTVLVKADELRKLSSAFDIVAKKAEP